MGLTPDKYTSDLTKQKLKELILYISDRCEFDMRFGMIRLNKTILFADVSSYVRYGESITGTQYMKEKYGSVPIHITQIIDEMKADYDIAIREQQYLRYTRKRVIPLRDAKLEHFKPRDIALVEEVIHNHSNFTARMISHLSHGTAWQLAEMYEVIPYEAFLISDNQKLTLQDIEEGRALIKQYGWEQYAQA